MKPGGEEGLYVAAAAWPFQTGADPLPLEHDERRECPDAETLDEVGPLLLRYTVELERAVVPPALKHLREKPLDSPAVT